MEPPKDKLIQKTHSKQHKTNKKVFPTAVYPQNILKIHKPLELKFFRLQAFRALLQKREALRASKRRGAQGALGARKTQLEKRHI